MSLTDHHLDPGLFISRWSAVFGQTTEPVWRLPSVAERVITEKFKGLPGEYVKNGTAYIHHSANIEPHVTMKGAIIIGPGCFIGSHAYLRGGVFLDEGVVVGPGCEVKSSFIFRRSALAHFNFAGDSIIGENVNMEAGSILANHYNEREDKSIRSLINGEIFLLPVNKFGSFIGDGSKIGANAVLSPGTVLSPNSIVKRLELVEQVKLS
ncbi:DapH/DapD/GlmU-related protein [Chryseolinea sp. T2]|uniref:DapH/DapD/GlmU-related protein n=1 Tax=Chryseolinea sp. T2 TaxID=3129255 RepID=UPI003076FEE4